MFTVLSNPLFFRNLQSVVSSLSFSSVGLLVAQGYKTLCSTRLSMKFQILIKTEILKNKILSRVVFILLINVKMPTHCRINNMPR